MIEPALVLHAKGIVMCLVIMPWVVLIRGRGLQGITHTLRDALHDIAAALNPIKEGQHLLPGNNRRPADVYIGGWSAGLDTALDVTVINPLQEATLQGASTSAGHALRMRYTSKMTAAADLCQAEGIKFIPLVFESLGGWDDHAEREIKKISAALARQTGEEESETWKKIIGRISVILMKGNASLLSGRIPASPDRRSTK